MLRVASWSLLPHMFRGSSFLQDNPYSAAAGTIQVVGNIRSSRTMPTPYSRRVLPKFNSTSCWMVLWVEELGKVLGYLLVGEVSLCRRALATLACLQLCLAVY